MNVSALQKLRKQSGKSANTMLIIKYALLSSNVIKKIVWNFLKRLYTRSLNAINVINSHKRLTRKMVEIVAIASNVLIKILKWSHLMNMYLEEWENWYNQVKRELLKIFNLSKLGKNFKFLHFLLKTYKSTSLWLHLFVKLTQFQ